MKKFFKKIIDKIKSLDKGTICRTVLQIATYVNQLIALVGMTSFASSPVYQWITFGVTLVVTAVSYWYNNDWTNFAQLAGEILDMLSDGKITKEELEEFIQKHKDSKENK